jgi:hypothetical protein
MYHFSVFHASHHLDPHAASALEAKEEAAAIRGVARASCPIVAVIERVVVTPTGVVMALWNVKGGRAGACHSPHIARPSRHCHSRHVMSRHVTRPSRHVTVTVTHATSRHVSSRHAISGRHLTKWFAANQSFGRVAHQTKAAVIRSPDQNIFVCGFLTDGTEPADLRRRLRGALPQAPAKQIVADDVILHTTLARLLRPPPTREVGRCRLPV